MRRSIKTYARHFYRKCCFNFAITFLILILILILLRKSNDLQMKINFYNKPESFYAGPPKNVERIKIDWHDYEKINEEKKRVGLGEQGVKAKLDDTYDKVFVDEVISKNGYDGVLSDQISLNRSLWDNRHSECKTRKYLAELPSFSVVIPFYDEHFSVVMRTVHSVINRSPARLLREVVIVDDGSEKEALKEHLTEFVAKYLPMVKIVRNPERLGLIRARVNGAKVATGDVLIFLDAHTEANINWIPPLLEPIAENYRVCVCPYIDYIEPFTFEYNGSGEGMRGGFDWLFYYHHLPKFQKDKDNPSQIFESPVMVGGLFAISSKFFWEIGGYDEGLDIWGGEQFELSFKIWQCGGKMYDAPCSRVGHIYRKSPFKTPKSKGDVLTTNFKRVAEVWMDEYKEYLYMKNPKRWSIDPGDLTEQKAIRERNQCKSFKWFLETVAPDILAYFPPIEPPPFAYGAVQSVSNPSLCIDMLNKGQQGHIGTYPCARDLKNPQHNQFFELSWRKDIRNKDMSCWTVAGKHLNEPLIILRCYNINDKESFEYNAEHQMLNYTRYGTCLELNPINKTIYLNDCDKDNVNMKWKWGFVNETRMLDWNDTKVTPFEYSL